ncbi:uncharacterized protein LOC143808979 [Ranitomeya variabilis]
MDLKARETNWRSKASDLFKQGGSAGLQDVTIENRDLSIQYKNAVHKKTKTWWNKTTLENYVARDIVPRGLRVQVYPSFDLEDSELISRWKKAAITCSMEFMKIIIDKNTLCMNMLDKEIDELHRELKKQLAADKMESFIQTIEKEIDKKETEISDLKLKKFIRDTTDFETDKIFRWQLPKKKFNGSVTKTGGSSRELLSYAESSTSCSEAEGSNESFVRTRTSNRENRRYPDIFYNKKTNKRTNDRSKVINLSDHILTESQKLLLEKGLTFSPSSHLDKFEVVKDLHLFARKIILQKLHHRTDIDEIFSTEVEKEALKNLEELLDENESEEDDPPLMVYLRGNSFVLREFAVTRKIMTIKRRILSEDSLREDTVTGKLKKVSKRPLLFPGKNSCMATKEVTEKRLMRMELDLSPNLTNSGLN